MTTPSSPLVYPAYLDVPMMISFLATVDGGVRFEDQITVHHQDSKGTEKDVKARIGLPSVLSLLNLSASGRISGSSSENSNEEVSMVKRHTEASLFNTLLQRLESTGSIKRLTSVSDTAGVDLGDFIEISGEVVENPLKRLMTLLIRMAPLLEIDLEQLMKKGPPRVGPGKGKSTPAMDQDALEGVRLMLMFGADMFDASIEDLVIDTQDGGRVVVTADQEYLGDSTLQRLLGSDYKVLGKVTRVLGEQSPPINLTRRCALGLLPNAQVAELFENADKALKDDMEADLGQAVIGGPALQILPLAMYV